MTQADDRSRHLSAIVFILAALTLGLGIYAVNKGVYWDGWLLAGHHRDGNRLAIAREFREAANPITGWIHNLLGRFSNFVLAYHLTFWASSFVSSCLIYRWLTRCGRCGSVQAVLIACGVPLLPLVLVNFELILVPVGIYLSLFYLALNLVEVRQDRNWQSYAAITALLVPVALCAFTYETVLALWPFLAAWTVIASRNGRALPVTLARNVDLAVLPALYWTFRMIPSGPYSGRKEVTFSGSEAVAALRVVPTFLRHSAEVLAAAIGASAWTLALWAAVTVLFYGLLKRLARGSAEPPLSHRRVGSLALAGLLLTSIGVVPYLAARNLMEFGDWQSRNTVLAAFGFSILVMTVLSWGGRLLLLPSAVLGATVVFHWTAGSAWILDDLKQRSMMLHFAEASEIRDASIVIVDDQALHLNAHRRRYRTYEYEGQFHAVFRDQTRIGIDKDDVATYRALLKDFVRPPFYLRKDSRPCGRVQEVIVREGVVDRDALLWGYFGWLASPSDAYLQEIYQMTRVEYTSASAIPCEG